MNTLIVFHSKGGRTAKVAQEIYDAMSDEKEMIRIEPMEKEGGFFKCLAQAHGKEKVIIKDTIFDCAHFNTIILGTPMWDGRPSPFLTAWIDRAQNIAGKRIALFVTSRGSSGKIVNAMESILELKGVNIGEILILRSLFSFSSKKLKEAQEFGKKLSKG